MTIGNPIRTVMRFSIPVALGSLVQALYNTCDSAIAGRFLGAQALAAVGATASIIQLFLMIINRLTAAFSIVVSQYFGAKAPDMVRKTFVGCLYIVLFGAVLFGGAGVFLARPVMVLMQADPEIFEDAVCYLRICVGLSLGTLIYNVMTAMLQAVGDSKTPLYFLVISALLNVAMNILFVVVFQLGVAGLAWATVIAQGLSAAASFLYTWMKYPLFRITRQSLKPDWKLIRRTLGLGSSMVVQGALTTCGDVVISAQVNAFGTATVAAFSTVSQLHRLATLFFSALTNGLSVYVGQNFGARQLQRVKDGVKKIFLIVVLLGVLGGLFMILTGGALTGIFVDTADPGFAEIRNLSRDYQIICGLFYPFLTTIVVHNSALRGMGEKIAPMISGLMEIVFKLAGALILSQFIGVTAIWMASPLGWTAGIIPVVIQYYGGRWEKRIA